MLKAMTVMLMLPVSTFRLLMLVTATLVSQAVMDECAQILMNVAKWGPITATTARHTPGALTPLVRMSANVKMDMYEWMS